ncbi:3'-5' exonuclease [Uliginosibacterium sp. H1]|uniref:3'-5' exonuclease n=1 Tax=Uliginosibacterium sp. H1 TaxID=3114757 RepID=UPI002E19FA29|nr:3'-5' exonuclease [Uliginosibacterium sp. H1]
MAATLVFDIESIPDVAGIRKLENLPDDLADSEVAEWMFQKRRAATGSDFLPHFLQRIVTISCALRDGNSFRVFSLSEPDTDEAGIIQRFFDGIEKYTPQVVSWNGGGFDLPVLHYRGLQHAIVAPRYWDMGDGDYADSREFKWNNYISRYHTRHLDLMDLLAMYQPRASAPLDDLAKLCGFPGKLGMDGSAVWGAYQDGKIAEIRDYCETDVVNTYLVFLRFQLMRGALDADTYAQEIELVRDTLSRNEAAHWKEFLAAWKS